ncbi:MAG: L-serine ammonia-lyase, iron-sulfur-dependent, subunit alpha [Clostridia bacterium]|nr:L-serine ammonia-lyase, iron-sulfur-dependent, subunit alpha [Clostridia bacterium]
MEKSLYKGYVNILKEELLPAMGCTEPISVAYAAALARETLGCLPERVEIAVSGNILKNVKSVVVPNTGGMTGVNSAAAAGIVAGDANKKLEVISSVTPADNDRITAFMKSAIFSLNKSNSGCIFDICVSVFKGENSASVRIAGHHTNVVHIRKNGEDILNKAVSEEENSGYTDRSILTVEKIIEFADCVKIADVEEVIGRQIEYNKAISDEGLKNDYGARVGKVLLQSFGNGVHNLAKASAAAGSDARMNGCSKPVVIVSGSGNQGMTASLPVIVYANHLKTDREKLIRALVVSNLITVHLKTGIGRLSAYCGAVSAGCGAGAGICYLYGGKTEEVSKTVVNAVAINSGIICDGAKSSCAAKIASAVEAGILGFEMSRNGSSFCSGDGILGESVENTIDNVGDIARVGMRETDEEIIRLMVKNVKCG